MSEWTVSTPVNNPSTAPLTAVPRRTPIARVTIEVFSSKPGDTEVTLWVEKDGPMAMAQGKFGAERDQALLRLKALATHEMANALGKF